MTRKRSRYNLGVNATRCGLRPSEPLTGVLKVPLSKSLAQRAFIMAGLSGGRAIHGLSELEQGEDIRAARALVEQAGATVESMLPTLDELLLVFGCAPGPGRGWHSEHALELGESGTLARLVTAATGLCADVNQPISLAARGSLLSRTSPALFACLARAGVRIEFQGRANGWPVLLRPIAAPAELSLEDPSSSQEVSALLIAAAAWPHTIEIRVRGTIPSRPYLEMTLRMLAGFEVMVERSRDADTEAFRVRGPLGWNKDAIMIEPDASASAVALCAACINGGEISVSGLTAQSVQGDTRIVEHLSAFGCRAGFHPCRGMFAGGEITQGAELDLTGEPDLAPVLAAVAASAALRRGARSRLVGLGTLQGKESARITVLAEGLTALGLSVSASDSSLDIAPGNPTSGVLVLDPRGDHRMAFAFALFGLLLDGVDVLGAGCVSKSWPDFWSDMERAGARVVRSTT